MYIDRDEIEEMLAGYYDFSEVTDEMWAKIDEEVRLRMVDRGLDPQDDYDLYAAICDGAVGRAIHG